VLKYYLEYDFIVPTLLDLHFTVSKVPWLQLRVGQWKVTYNRERVDSSESSNSSIAPSSIASSPSTGSRE
jgi:hypothetical protein